VTQRSTKASELTTIEASKSEKSSQLMAANIAKKTAEESITTLQTQRTMQGADLVAIDAQIASQSVQAQAQAASATKIQVEVQTVVSQYEAVDKLNSELKAMFDAKNSEFVATTTKIQEWTAIKLAAEQKIEPATITLKSSTEALAASKSKFDVANVVQISVQQEVDRLQADIARYVAMPLELAAKKLSIEQAIAVSTAKVEPAESNVTASKSQLAAASTQIAMLEQQLAALQTLIAAEQAKRTDVQSELTAKQQDINGIRGQIQLSENELSNATMQQQLFEKAYGKK